MLGIGPTEFLVIIIVAVLVLGPEHLPRIMRTFTRIMSEVRRVSTDFQRTLNLEANQEEWRQQQAASPAEPKKKKKKVSPPDDTPATDDAPATGNATEAATSGIPPVEHPVAGENEPAASSREDSAAATSPPGGSASIPGVPADAPGGSAAIPDESADAARMNSAAEKTGPPLTQGDRA
jgi:sec-independent protein translocase protein TatB